MPSPMRVNLRPEMFGERERTLAHWGTLSAATFRYDSGVCGLRLTNDRGELEMLPFQGQQIWSARFDRRELTMRTMFDQPQPTQTYLETYGGFFIHCGVHGMGAPGPHDNHPLHGELPNAPFRDAFLQFGTDERGSYLALGGSYQHTVAFSHNYVAEPLVKLYADSTIVSAALTVTNLAHRDLELMYLAHLNFRPINDARLVYSALATPEHVRVRTQIPSHIHPAPGYVEFIEQLHQNPALHEHLTPELQFDPEVVFTIDYRADADGWAHALQVLPDGSADYVAHRPEQLPKGMRWISRTPDQDALGFCMPATAEPEGYTAEKAKGNLRLVPPGENFHCDLLFGTLAAADAAAIAARIAGITQLRMEN